MLEGIQVLDLTRYLPGPFATRLLADLGADVIKLEGPQAPDPFRTWPPVGADGSSRVFAALNHGKRSLALDLKHPEGRALCLRLIERVDVLIESFRPGVLARLGLGADACRARNPALVYCSLSGFGQDGPYRDRPGHDVTYMAHAGVLSVLSDREGRPVLPGLQIADTLGAYSALAGILAALVARARTGRGDTLDVAMTDALIGAQSLGLALHQAGQPTGAGETALRGACPCYGVYRTADGRAVALGALEPAFWRAFCQRVGRPEWEARGYDATLVPEVAQLFATRSRDAWAAELEGAGCCLAPVRGYGELALDPHFAARGLSADGRIPPPARSASSAGGRTVQGGAVPRLGQHSAEVLAELLDLGAEELARLSQVGALAVEPAAGEERQGAGRAAR